MESNFDKIHQSWAEPIDLLSLSISINFKPKILVSSLLSFTYDGMFREFLFAFFIIIKFHPKNNDPKWHRFIFQRTFYKAIYWSNWLVEMIVSLFARCLSRGSIRCLVSRNINMTLPLLHNQPTCVNRSKYASDIFANFSLEMSAGLISRISASV